MPNIGDTIHTNENYKVVVWDLDAEIGGIFYPFGYAALNLLTGVPEYISPSLADALYTSEHLNQALVSEAWKWRKEVAVAAQLSDLVN